MADANLTSRTVNALKSWPLFLLFLNDILGMYFPNGGSALSSECCHEVIFYTTFFYIPKFWTFTFSVTQPQVVLNRANTKFSEHIRKLSSFTWDRPPKLSSLVVRSLECRNIVSFFHFWVYRVCLKSPRLNFTQLMFTCIVSSFRNKNVLSSSRLIYWAPIPCFKYFSLPDTFIMPCGQTENLTRMRFEWSVFQKDQKLV